MIEIFGNPNYDFIGRRKWAYIVSIVFTLLGLVSIGVKGGLRYDIDFTGGTLIQVRFDEPPAIDKIRASLGQIGLGESVIQQFGDPREDILRMPLTATSPEEIGRRVQAALSADPALGRLDIRRGELVGSQVGRDLQLQAIYAVLAGLGGVLPYIAGRVAPTGGGAGGDALFPDLLGCPRAVSPTHPEVLPPRAVRLLT